MCLQLIGEEMPLEQRRPFLGYPWKLSDRGKRPFQQGSLDQKVAVQLNQVLWGIGTEDTERVKSYY